MVFSCSIWNIISENLCDKIITYALTPRLVTFFQLAGDHQPGLPLVLLLWPSVSLEKNQVERKILQRFLASWNCILLLSFQFWRTIRQIDSTSCWKPQQKHFWNDNLYLRASSCSPEDWGLRNTDSEKTKKDLASWMAWLPRILLLLFPSMLKRLLDLSASSICFILAKNLRLREEYKTLAQLYAVCDVNLSLYMWSKRWKGHGMPCSPCSQSPSWWGAVSYSGLHVCVA